MISNPFDYCPECEDDVEFYDTADDEKSGKYRCKLCGRDTSWAMEKSESIFNIIENLRENIDKCDSSNSIRKLGNLKILCTLEKDEK